MRRGRHWLDSKDTQRHFVEKNGQRVEKNGQRVEKNGQRVEKNGQRVEKNGQPHWVTPTRPAVVGATPWGLGRQIKP